MDNLNLYKIETEELSDIIDKVKVELKETNTEYKELLNRIKEIKEKSSNIKRILEDQEIIAISKEECEYIQEIINIYMRLHILEEENIFYAGAKENYYYLRKIGIIK